MLSVLMLSILMLSVLVLSVIMLSVLMLNVIYAECPYAESRGALFITALYRLYQNKATCAVPFWKLFSSAK
jgi:hypothetical protein